MNIRSIRPSVQWAAVLALAVLAAAACNPIENGTTSNTRLIIENLTGLDLQGIDSQFCRSDVLVTNSQTGTATIVADIGKATLSSQPLDPSPIVGNSTYLDIQLEKIAVSYTRADGHNIPGTDVPYSFEAGLSGTVRVGSLTMLSFTLVREAAKEERPLVTLQGTGDVLEATATIIFYGKDLSGRAVMATGYLPITFADYANI
ncbi:MAG: hypothetical protein NTZ26_08145 [Candidatus Aminicenantes bacterium]|nr:hypothetical protein [Candidatus Aminicenantes bacterium]